MTGQEEKEAARLHAWILAKERMESLANVLGTDEELHTVESLIGVLAVICAIHRETSPTIVLGMLAGSMMEAEMMAEETYTALQEFLESLGGSPN